ncbi:MAG TPA: TonB-dependent receptor plug domain-containing protein, partial [Longimicrobium sp.]|nr:TonB-dependent receptor plug domain-containing protein [Longimicrobium sp.]
DSVVELRLLMAVASVALEPVTVVARSPRRVSPTLRGFYQRMSNGPGRFVTREEIESRRPTRVTDVLRNMPNLNLIPGRGGMGGGTMSRGSSGGRCSVVFFIDGMLVSTPANGVPWRGGARTDRPIDDYVQPGDIEGIEIYRGESDTPAEFVTRYVSCGTIVIWTRRGEMRSEREG